MNQEQIDLWNKHHESTFAFIDGIVDKLQAQMEGKVITPEDWLEMYRTAIIVWENSQ